MTAMSTDFLLVEEINKIEIFFTGIFHNQATNIAVLITKSSETKTILVFDGK